MVKRISPSEAHALLGEGYTYLDVRSTPEFERGHPDGAVSIPLMEAGPAGMQPNPAFMQQVEATFPKDAKLVIGCESGGRSARAASLLEQAGYTEIVEQRCGFGGARDSSGRVVEPGWRESGLPITTGKAG